MKRLVEMYVVLAVFLVSVVSAQVRPSGSYWMFNRNFSPAETGQEFGDMKAVGMDKVIPISVGHLTGAPGTPGGPCTALSADGLLYPSSLVSNPPSEDKLGNFLSVADAKGMKVYLGSLRTFGDWTTGTEFDSLRSCNKAVVQEVIARYGSHPSLVGFYWTQEIWLNWVKHSGPSYYGISLLNQFVSDVRAIDPTKVVFTAPVFKKDGVGAMPGLTAQGTGVALNLLLAGSGLKLVAPQDGQGALSGAPSVVEIGSYYSAMLSAALPHGAALWSTLETFVNNGGDQNRYPPAPISRIAQQISAQAPYVSGMITWIFGHDMSPQATYYPIAASQLYMDYQSYYNGTPRPQKLGFTYQYLNQPHTNYADPGLKLNDGQGGGFGSNGSDWVAFSDVGDVHQVKIRLSFSQPRRITRVRVLFRSEMDSFIKFPDYVFGTELPISQFGAWFLGPIGPVQYPVDPNTPKFSVGWAEWTDSPFGFPISVTLSELTMDLRFWAWLMLAEVEVYGN